MGRKAIDMAGKRVGRLTVIRRVGINSVGATWLCKCACGNDKIVPGSFLNRQVVKSCGCLRSEVSRKLIAEVRRRTGGRNRLRHGEAIAGRETTEWKLWHSIRQRCGVVGVGHPDYSGRGIEMCDRWQQSYEDFVKDVGRRPSKAHSLDRIDVFGGYEPGNVRWATAKEQARNRRNSLFIEAFGERLTLAEWSERSGIQNTTIRQRLQRGWSPEKAVSTVVAA